MRRTETGLYTIITCYIGIYIVAKMLRQFSDAPAPFMQYGLYPIGAILIAVLFFKAKRLTAMDRFLPPVVCLWFLLSELLKGTASWVDLFCSTLIIMLAWCLSYWYGCSLDLRTSEKTLRQLLGAICAFFSAVCLLCFVNLFYRFLPDTGAWQYFGIYGNRLWMFVHPNGTAYLCVMGVAYCGYLLLIGEKKHRIAYAVLLIPMLLCLALTDSRTNQLTFCAGMGLFAFRFVSDRVKRGKLRFAVCLVCSVAVAITLYCGIILSAKGISSVLNNQYAAPESESSGVVAQSSERPTVADAHETTDTIPDGNTASIRPVGDLSTLSSRVLLWKSWIPLLFTEPNAWLIGTNATPPEKLEGGLGVHSSYLAPLIHNGALALLLIAAFLARLVRPCWRLYCKGPLAACVIPIIIAVSVIDATVDMYLFYTIDVGNLLFFLAAGLTVNYAALVSAEGCGWRSSGKTPAHDGAGYPSGL